MSGPINRRTPYLFFCWLYIVLGVVSMSAGGFLLMAPWLFARKSPASLDTGIQVIAAICILFGLMRIGNSIYHIRRLSRL